ncbi:MAG: tRNA-dependent cyclodipeptide synthase [Rhodospirillales bacterium]|nr:tRNA-dependent cyclodipeptide synthase [Rhodospirillales bacterium]
MSATNPTKDKYYYKVRARYGHDWREHDTVRMEISVGRAYQEGAKLEAAMEWATAHFKRVVVLVADTQQRYNFMFADPLSEEKAFAKASALGETWIARNEDCLKRANVEIVRWEDVKQDPAYMDAYAAIVKLYDTDKEFKRDVDRGITEHWQRQDLSDGDFHRYFALSKSYALEELAVFSIFYKDQGGISAYPGTLTFTQAMYENKDTNDAPAGFQNAHYTCLNFERRKYEAAQQDYRRAA